ncbi:FHF complex subunit HOOK interacting protein 2B [Oncorhynchus tshawytscha]|uniref:FHF complex subunit HOOK-interacting protein C-terminal domain-containing protein n=1 Tax=Oncorhynchus tshawytscha TaxID=74940 RepID=A0AAZ3RBR7_ONCTS|nr:FHF complex subunit HOOK interacting protein 2B [Oncorhynchus tshawytscha]
MDMLSKLTHLFQQALETREPPVNLLDSFVDHWKGITNYYIETTGQTRPVKQTDIPWRLKQMLDILVYEEAQQGQEEMGPCMEYLLQHKLLETLCTLGKAQYPPGMNQQVLVFFSKILVQIQKPMLHILNVYRPVQKLVRLCGLPGSQTEKEEAQFMFVVCSRVKQDPYVLNYILEIKKDNHSKRSISTSEDTEKGRSGETVSSNYPTASDPASTSSPQQHSPTDSPSTIFPANAGLIHVLVHLSRSQKSRVALKAFESLLLLVSIPKEDTAVCLAESTPLCQLLAERLCELFSQLPATLEPADIHSFPQTHWNVPFSQSGMQESQSFPGSEHMENFFAWLDFLDHLMREAPKSLAVKLAKEIHHCWLVGVLQHELLQMSEMGVLVNTALLCCSVRHIQSPAMVEELVSFLLGRQTQSEQRLDTESHVLRYQLIEHCDHISDEISITTLLLFEALLQKPHREILFNLVLRNLENRCYLTRTLGGGDDCRHFTDTDPVEENEELEEDPFFTDMYGEDEFNSSEQLLHRPQLIREHRCSGQTQALDIVNSFLCLVPQEAKTSQHVQGARYETYVHDAHEQFKECTAFLLDWDWPESLKPTELSVSSSDFFEGHFLKVLFDRIGRILEQPYELNLQVTSVLSRLAVFPHPHLHEYLLDPYIILAPGARSLFSVLIRVIGELMQRIEVIPNFTEKLVHVRRQLMGLDGESGVDHMPLLKGVIILEEFCKELAAIAFVKLPANNTNLQNTDTL